MKQVIFLILSIAMSPLGFSQAYEGSTEYNKKTQAAFVIEYHYSPEATENAILQKMEKMGNKGKEEKGLFNKDKGFLVYKNAFITDISTGRMDYIIKVDQKSKKEKDESIVYLIINKDGENAMAKFDAAD